MRKPRLVLGILSGLGVGCFFPFDSPPPEGPTLIYVLPQGFSGWACTDFGVAGAPTLEKEGAAFVIRPQSGEIQQTSHPKKDLLFAKTDQYFEEALPARKALPIEWLRRKSFQEDTDYPDARHCVFFGSAEESERAGEAPKLEHNVQSK